uniref:MULE transposase domain-containing protein n=1 Tax=Acrobeloides nanus TaxID=290746 RepID=A0A914D8A8_9BILA
MWHDSGLVGGSRFIVFATDEDVARLRSCEIIGVDGTFATQPRHFAQLWVLHGFCNNRFVPLVYVLCSHKTTAVYESILRSLGNLLVQVVLMDFERPERNAFENVFIGVILICCHFHQSQAISKAWSNSGIKVKDLKKSPALRHCLRRFLYIGFVRKDDLFESYEELIEELKTLLGPESNAVAEIV